MKKILIISYFFPPCNLTASHRVYSWARYFHRYGLYPIIITRNWEHPVGSPGDILKPGGDRVIHEKKEEYEAYYLPHKGSLRDRIYERFHDTAFGALSKPFTLLELIGQNYFSALTPFRYMEKFARGLLKESPDIEDMLISGNPFILFKSGYRLKKEFPRIRWIADYRDDWTTSEINRHEGFLRSMVHKAEAVSEKKWLSNARFITSVSPWYTQKIAAYTGREGYTIYNGFDRLIPGETSAQQTFNIVYNGTLYGTQKVEDFCASVKKVIARNSDIRFRLQFPGLAFDPVQARRVREAMQGYEELPEITGRIPQNEVLDIQKNAHVLLMFSHPGVKGITSSKLFEYLSLRRPVLVYPGDNDILDEIIRETSCGTVCADQSAMEQEMEKLVTEYRNTGTTAVHANDAAILKYSREKQAEILAGLILRHLSR